MICMLQHNKYMWKKVMLSEWNLIMEDSGVDVKTSIILALLYDCESILCDIF